jgi:DNA-binding PadR family transcriptional regulator
MYRLVARLMTSALVTEAEGNDSAAHPGLARKYYTLTQRGRNALAAEARRLRRAVVIGVVDDVMQNDFREEPQELV